MRSFLGILLIQMLSLSIVQSQSSNVRIDCQIIGYDGTKKVNYSIAPAYDSGNNGLVQN